MFPADTCKHFNLIKLQGVELKPTWAQRESKFYENNDLMKYGNDGEFYIGIVRRESEFLMKLWTIFDTQVYLIFERRYFHTLSERGLHICITTRQNFIEKNSLIRSADSFEMLSEFLKFSMNSRNAWKFLKTENFCNAPKISERHCNIWDASKLSEMHQEFINIIY